MAKRKAENEKERAAVSQLPEGFVRDSAATDVDKETKKLDDEEEEVKQLLQEAEEAIQSAGPAESKPVARRKTGLWKKLKEN